MAVVDMLLKLDGIEGGTADSLGMEESKMDVLSWTWELSQSGSMHIGRGGGVGKVSVKDIAITKYIDKATPDLITHCCNGTHIGEALLTIRKAGDGQQDFMTIKMENVIVSNILTGVNKDDGVELPTEVVKLNFSKFEVSYRPQGLDGILGKEVTQAYDIAGVDLM